MDSVKKNESYNYTILDYEAEQNGHRRIVTAKQTVLYHCNCPFFLAVTDNRSGVNDVPIGLVHRILANLGESWRILAKLLEVATTMGKHGKGQQISRSYLRYVSILVASGVF